MDLLELIPEIYDAAADPSRWPHLMDRISDLVGANSSALIVQDMKTGIGKGVHSRIDPKFLQDYFTRFAQSNVLLQNGHKVRTGDILFEREIAPWDVLESSEYYRDLLLPYNVPQIMALTVWSEPQRLGVLNLTRGRRDDYFGDSERAICRALMPHLQRAFVITSRLQELEARIQDGRTALEKVSWGAILIESGNRISFANRIAESILRCGDGLINRLGKLGTRTLADNAKLAQAIDLARQGEGSALAVARGGLSSYTLLITPLGERQGWLAMREQTILVAVTDPERPSDVNIDRLKSIYGLTTAEAALAARLATGSELTQAARQLGIQHETARTHLKRVFLKLGVSKQSELVSRVVREAMILAP